MARALPVLGAALMLGACSSGAVAPPDVAPSYRDMSVQISSNALFDPARYAGRWYEVARYPVAFRNGCVGAQTVYTPLPDGTLGVQNTCREGTPDGTPTRIAGRARITGPGRFEVRFDSGPELPASHWVLWVDEGYRTAVVGMPSGQAGWILNRDPEIPADRLAAAREVLAFNGYDLGPLMTVPQK